MLEKNRFDFPDDLSVYSILELLDTDAIIDHLAKGAVSFDEFAKAFSKAGGDLDLLPVGKQAQGNGYRRNHTKKLKDSFGTSSIKVHKRLLFVL
jgi:hypothetical protein